MINTTRPSKDSVHEFRVDLDHHGDWCVWRRMSHNGWTAIETCESHNGAVNRAARLNATPEAETQNSSG